MRRNQGTRESGTFFAFGKEFSLLARLLPVLLRFCFRRSHRRLISDRCRCSSASSECLTRRCNPRCCHAPVSRPSPSWRSQANSSSCCSQVRTPCERHTPAERAVWSETLVLALNSDFSLIDCFLCCCFRRRLVPECAFDCERLAGAAMASVRRTAHSRHPNRSDAAR